MIDSRKNKFDLEACKNNDVNLDLRLSELLHKGAHCRTLKVFEQCLRVKLSPPIVVVKTQHRIGKDHRTSTRLDTNGHCARKSRAEAHKG